MTTTNGDDGVVVRITMKDVYSKLEHQGEALVDMARAVEALSGEMKGSLALLVARSDTATEDLKDHEARLRMVESRKVVSPREMWVGASVIIAALGLMLTVIGMAAGLGA